MQIYSEVELVEELKKNNSNWVNKHLECIKSEFIFKDFKDSIKFVNEIAEVAENMNHHPNIKINFNKVKLKVFTHSENAITNLDTKLAFLIDDIYKKYV